jgi:hypothetical protein
MKVLVTRIVLWFATPIGQGVYHVGRDAIEGGIGGVVILNLAVPGTLDQAKAEGLLAVAAFAGAAIAVVRREFIPYVWAKLVS